MPDVEPVNIGALIAPDKYHGRPVLAGTRMTIVGMISYHNGGWSVEEIARNRDLTLAQVYAALAYYYADQEQIDKEMAEEEAEYDRQAEASRFAGEGRR